MIYFKDWTKILFKRIIFCSLKIADNRYIFQLIASEAYHRQTPCIHLFNKYFMRLKSETSIVICTKNRKVNKIVRVIISVLWEDRRKQFPYYQECDMASVGQYSVLWRAGEFK